MIRLFPLIIIIQVYCFYHAYKNNAEQKWYWLIFFLPVIGSLFYLYFHFYNRQNLTTISEGIKGVINTNYSLERLKNEVEISDSVLNKSRLADEYVKMGSYNEAIDLYKSCLEGFNKGDVDSLKSLIKAHYLNDEFKQVVKYGAELNGHKDFIKSESRICYAWSLFQIDQFKKAEENFNDMDLQYDNYPHRIEFSKFLYKIDKKEAAFEKLELLMKEYNQMNPNEKRNKKDLYREIQNVYSGLKEEA